MPDITIPILVAQDALPSGASGMDGGTASTPGAPTPAGGDGGGGGGNPLFSWPVLIIIFVVFYMMLIRPQSKEKRKREELLKGLKRGDRVILTSGMHGEIISIDDKTAVIEIDDGVRPTFDRAAIWQPEVMVSPTASPAADAKSAAAAGAAKASGSTKGK